MQLREGRELRKGLLPSKILKHVSAIIVDDRFRSDFSYVFMHLLKFRATSTLQTFVSSHVQKANQNDTKSNSDIRTVTKTIPLAAFVFFHELPITFIGFILVLKY